MKTTTTASNIGGTTLQAGLVAVPAKLVRSGVMALALTAAGIGFFGAGSAFADGPRTTGQTVNTQVAQTTQIKKTTGNSTLGNVNTVKVMSAKASSSGTGKNGKSCAGEANLINELNDQSDEAASFGDYEASFDSAKEADRVTNRAVSNGCVIIWQ